MKNEVDGINYLNVSCDEIFDSVKWRDAKVVASLLFLACINVVVIIGNCLVIIAVFISQKLRTVTNLFIVSLAVADLLVGVAVLPFSATWEIFEVWIFGELWCSIWLAVDVWMCTASILNLCAISLDRYVAVTRPINYQSLMSPKRAKILIACVWILSFLICFPPLVGWNDRKRTISRLANATTTPAPPDKNEGEEEDEDFEGWSSASTSEAPFEPDLVYLEEECSYTCELTNDKGYVVYSAIGSFFLPTFVMLFFYWRIYKAAVETTKAINQGFRTTKGTRLLGTRFEEQRLTLRIHRGRSVQNHLQCPTSPKPISPNNGRHASNNSSATTSPSTKVPRSRSQERLKPTHLAPPVATRGGKRSASYRTKSTYKSPTPSPNGVRAGPSNQQGGPLPGPSTRREKMQYLQSPQFTDGRRRHKKDSDSDSTPNASPTLGPAKYDVISTASSTGEETKPKLISKMGKRNIKAQVKRFRIEQKAAKTLGIIVGGFIGCWLPFFTCYVIGAFCKTCVPPLLFSFLFWLGYCNSAINPCIYALFSKDFRFAFKKIICRFFCMKAKKPPPHVIPIFLSSLGEDSEGNNENEEEEPDGSDSR